MLYNKNAEKVEKMKKNYYGSEFTFFCSILRMFYLNNS